MAAGKVVHPSWCGPACDAGREGGKHRGASVVVAGARSRIATVWLEQLGDGPAMVGHAAVSPMSPEDAMRVAKAIEAVAGLVGVRV